MSAFGTKRTSRHAQRMSAFGGKADIDLTFRLIATGTSGGLLFSALTFAVGPRDIVRRHLMCF